MAPNFVEAARKTLAYTIGSAYQKAVISCLEVKTETTKDAKPNIAAIADFYLHVIPDFDLEGL